MLGNLNYKEGFRDSEEPGRQTQRQPKVRKLLQKYESPSKPSEEESIHDFPWPMPNYRHQCTFPSQLLQICNISKLELHRLRLLATLKYEFSFKEGRLQRAAFLNQLLKGQLYLQREFVMAPASLEKQTGYNFHCIKIISPTLTAQSSTASLAANLLERVTTVLIIQVNTN